MKPDKPQPSQKAYTILCLSSALLDDRKMLYSEFSNLAADHHLAVWTTSHAHDDYLKEWAPTGAEIAALPDARPYGYMPDEMLYKITDKAFEFQFDSKARKSMRQARMETPGSKLHANLTLVLGKTVAAARAQPALERRVMKKLNRVGRSPEARKMLEQLKPDVVVVTGPNRSQEPAIAIEARMQGIPVIAAIHSWDNLTTKRRMIVDYDAYIVWAEAMKADLLTCYPYAEKKPIYITGASQYDVFWNPEFHLSKGEFCAQYGFDPAKPILLHALGSPNLIVEYPAAQQLVQWLKNGRLGDAQLIIRPHPQFDDGQLRSLLPDLPPNAVIQNNRDAGKPLNLRFQSRADIIEWVNTFRHCDVLINSSSSVTIDAAIQDMPVINLDFDPEGRQNQLVWDINHLWPHFKPIAESDGLWLAKDYDSVLEGINAYLEDPSLHRAGRAWIGEYVIGTLDGQAGKRMADAVLHFLASYRA